MNNEPQNTLIHISTGTIIKSLLFIILVLALYFLRDIVLIILTAIVIASAIEPATRYLVEKKIPRTFSVVILYVLVIFALAAVFYFLLPTLLSETTSFLERINSIDVLGSLKEQGILSPDNPLQGLSSQFNLQGVIGSVRGVVNQFSSGFFNTASILFGGALSFILIFVLSFYFAVQEDGVEDFLQVASPIRYKNYVTDLWKRSQKKIGLWLQGQLLLGLLVGVLDFLGLTIFGIKHALLLAVLAALLEIIPLFGPILSAIPGVAIAFVSGGTPLALLVLALYVIVQQFENHLIYPLVVNKIVGISPILVIISLLVGWRLAGFLGVLLSVPVAAVFMEYYSDVRKNKFGHLTKVREG
ncbi:MAG: AI-2E family transporter [Candidatus Pacebacteria bacterium]|nr:AI-2E family transporter [Candidatus Paceibacterota bacterium]MDD5356945.1 AI-2E family transporter [Candidatus Paceibacterota bacterium]